MDLQLMRLNSLNTLRYYNLSLSSLSISYLSINSFHTTLSDNHKCVRWSMVIAIRMLYEDVGAQSNSDHHGAPYISVNIDIFEKYTFHIGLNDSYFHNLLYYLYFLIIINNI